MKDQTTKLKFVYRVMLVTGAFCTIVTILLLLNFWQIQHNKPLDNVSLKTLVDRLNADPNNDALKVDIRNLDLLARKAYFNSEWQVTTGGILLLLGAIAFFASLKIYRDMQAKIEVPVDLDKNDAIAGVLSQRWLLVTIAIFFVGALSASYLSTDYLKMYNNSIAGALKTNTNRIKQVSITSANDSTAKDSTSGANANVFITMADIRKQSNGFRGPFGNGVSTQKNIPTSWDGSKGRKVIWKVKVPKPGYNSPVIWNDKVFLAGADKGGEAVFCFDLATGKLLWQKAIGRLPGSPASSPEVSQDTGLSPSTVVVDGQRVFAIFPTGDLICLDFNGNKVWSKNIGEPDNHYGHASSLIALKDKLFIQYDSNKGGRIMALNVQTGNTVWDIRRKTQISWTSPVIMVANNKTQLVTSANPLVAGYDTETGKELWSVDCMAGEVAPSVCYNGGIVFAGNENAKLVAIQPGSPAKTLWENDEYLPEVSSPVAANGLLFVCTSSGTMVCYDGITGKKQWESEFGKPFFASPVITEGKVYAMDNGGKMHIVKVSRTKKILGEPTLGERAYATPAFTDGKIVIRGANNLYCIGEK
ncbi:MAG: PQQ-binding-like beta-propeller repeat protein [Bacteroidota bacterium]|nr:PQQ-binding-like beta-propeller repeat protein [Bacteroidota bacterium]